MAGNMNRNVKVFGCAVVVMSAAVNADVNDREQESGASIVKIESIDKRNQYKSTVEAIKLKNFDVRIHDEATFWTAYDRAWDDLAASTNKFFAKAVMIFQDSYREHLDMQRAKENPSDLLRDDNYKYFLTLYGVIVNEIARMVFDIKLENDPVSYVNKDKDDIIECISNGESKFKTIEDYDPSNWNYLLLVNVLNQVKNSDIEINKEIIQCAAEKILKEDKYKGYETRINNAVSDITTYFNQLELYSYLKRTRKLALLPCQIKSKTGLLSLQPLFEQHALKEYSSDKQWIDIVKLIPRNKEDAEITYFTWKGQKMTDGYTFADRVYRYKASKIPSEFRTFYLNSTNRQQQIRQGDLFDRQYKGGCLTEKDSLMLYALNEIISFREQEVMQVVNEIYKKAQDEKLSDDEKIFLDLYNLSKLERDTPQQLLHIRNMKHYNDIITQFWDLFEMGEVDAYRMNVKNWLSLCREHMKNIGLS